MLKISLKESREGSMNDARKKFQMELLRNRGGIPEESREKLLKKSRERSVK